MNHLQDINEFYKNFKTIKYPYTSYLKVALTKAPKIDRMKGPLKQTSHWTTDQIKQETVKEEID